MIYLNKAMLTVFYELDLGSYLKLLVLITYDGSDPSETVSLKFINDLLVVVLDISKS